MPASMPVLLNHCNRRTGFTKTVNDSAADAAPAPVMTATFRSNSLLTHYAASAGQRLL